MARLNPRLFPCAAVAAMGASLFFTSPARADDVHDARVLYQKGNAAFKRGDSILARDFYSKSLEIYESFDTRCNLGRTQAGDQLFAEAYFNLGICVELYPRDEEDLANSYERFVGLKNEVRGRLASSDASRIEGDVAEHVEAWRKKSERSKLPASGLGESPEEDVDSKVGEEEGGTSDSSSASEGAAQKNGWKLPVVISLAGAGVVSGVVGGVMFGVAGGHQKTADDLREKLGPSGCFDEDALSDSQVSDCAEQEFQRNKRDSAMDLGTTFAVVGGGLLVSSLAVALLVPSERAAETGWKSVRPQVGFGANDLSLGLSGRF